MVEVTSVKENVNLAASDLTDVTVHTKTNHKSANLIWANKQYV